MGIARETEQERVEELFAESTRDYEERRRQRYALDWIAFHERQARALEATLGCLVHQHLVEGDRYRQLLNGTSTTEGEANE